MHFQLMSTDDGSLSCLDFETGELSHNRAGAYTEALQNYILPSLLLEKVKNTDYIKVLDVCYGMGYNSWTLVNEVLKQGNVAQRTGMKPLTLSIVGIEKHPEVIHFLPHVFKHPTFDDLRNKLSQSEHNIYYRTLMGTFYTKVGMPDGLSIMFNLTDWFRLEFTLWVDDIRCRVPKIGADFDAIFHDPFSPQKMPELWSEDLFRHYHHALKKKQGLMLTYSTAAAVRGGLMEAGFQVLKTQGVGKKAGSTLALTSTTSRAINEELTIPLASWEVAYLQSRAGLPYRDAGLQQSRQQIIEQRKMEQEASDRPSGANALKQKPRYLHNP
jgi:tRNA U34 5-methylaminomethyl-2-thiouridine-forming methyltransferase MnmC